MPATNAFTEARACRHSAGSHSSKRFTQIKNGVFTRIKNAKLGLASSTLGIAVYRDHWRA